MDELIIDEHALKHGLEPEDIEYACTTSSPRSTGALRTRVRS